MEAVGDGIRPNAPRAQIQLRWMYATCFAVLGAVIPYLALELTRRGLRGGYLALALGVLPLGRLFAGPLWSYAADARQAPRRMMQYGAILAMVGAVIVAWAPDLAGATGISVTLLSILAMLVFSLGRASAGPLLDSMVLGSLAGDRLGYGRVRRWGSLGFLVAALSLGALADHGRITPLMVGAFLAALFLGQTVRMRGVDGAARPAVLPALVTLGRDPAVRWMLLTAALHFSAHVGSTSFLAVHFDSMGLPTVWTGVALAVGVTVEIGVMSRGDALLSRFRPVWVFAFAVALAVPRWWLMARVTHPVGLVLLQGLHGITFGAFWIAGVARMAERAPAVVQTSAQGLFAAAVGGVGALMGLVGASLIVDSWGTRVMFEVGTGMALLATATALIAARRA